MDKYHITFQLVCDSLIWLQVNLCSQLHAIDESLTLQSTLWQWNETENEMECLTNNHTHNQWTRQCHTHNDSVSESLIEWLTETGLTDLWHSLHYSESVTVLVSEWVTSQVND